MSLESKIEELTKAINENTAALLASQGKTVVNNTTGKDEPAAADTGKGKGRGKGKGKDDNKDDNKDDGADPFAEGDDPFAEEESEKVYTADEIKALIFKVRKEKGDDAALKIITDQGVTTIGKIAEKQYPSVVAAAKKLGVTP